LQAEVITFIIEGENSLFALSPMPNGFGKSANVVFDHRS
jgi:hypothetical protein